MYNSSMKLHLKKWGNSLGLRIPKIFAVELGIDDGATVDVAVEGNTIVIRNTPSLETLLQKVSDENLHSETQWGDVTGTETW